MRKAHFKILAVDESDYWLKGITDKTGKIYGVYLIDTNEHTYCCELQPSYCAFFLYETWENQVSGRLSREIVEASLINTDPVSYFHVSEELRFEYDFGEQELDENYTYDEHLEDMIEHCRDNHYF